MKQMGVRVAVDLPEQNVASVVARPIVVGPPLELRREKSCVNNSGGTISSQEARTTTTAGTRRAVSPARARYTLKPPDASQ